MFNPEKKTKNAKESPSFLRRAIRWRYDSVEVEGPGNTSVYRRLRKEGQPEFYIQIQP